MQQQVLALSAASNLITSVLGLYVGVWVALPLADRMYRSLSKRWKQPEEKRGDAAAMKSASAACWRRRRPCRWPPPSWSSA